MTRALPALLVLGLLLPGLRRRGPGDLRPRRGRAGAVALRPRELRALRARVGQARADPRARDPGRRGRLLARRPGDRAPRAGPAGVGLRAPLAGVRGPHRLRHRRPRPRVRLLPGRRRRSARGASRPSPARRCRSCASGGSTSRSRTCGGSSGARAAAGAQVILGGHSLGASMAVAYAAWDFGGRAGHRDLSGLVLIDGGLARHRRRRARRRPAATRRAARRRPVPRPARDRRAVGLGRVERRGRAVHAARPDARATLTDFPLLPRVAARAVPGHQRGGARLRVRPHDLARGARADPGPRGPRRDRAATRGRGRTAR